MMIEEFRLWATKLGCPQERMPCDESLKSVFKSPQRDLLINLMKRVQPCQDVKAVRQNILISKIDQMKGQILVPVSGRSFLPKEMQLYLKKRDLVKRKLELESKLEECRREYETLATSIKRMNLHSIILDSDHKRMDGRVTVLRFKAKALDADLVRKESLRDRINATMPIKLLATNASEKEATQAVEEALEELNLFYNDHSNSSNNNALVPKTIMDELWQKMREIFANVPAFLIFNVLMRKKDEQLQNITTMKRANVDDWQSQTLNSLLTAGSVPKEPLNSFEMELLKTKADLIALVSKYIAACNDHKVLEQHFANAYARFVCEVQNKVQLLNEEYDESEANEIISDFLIEYTSFNFSKAENEYLTQQIEQYKLSIEQNGKKLEKHEILLGSIKTMYSNINTSINRIQYEMLQLGQIKEKIVYSKNLMKLMLDDVQAATAANAKVHLLSAQKKLSTAAVAAAAAATATAVNSSILSTAGVGGVDSFELGGGDVFCSTKLDFDCTITSSRHNSTVLRGAGGGGVAGGGGGSSFTTVDATNLGANGGGTDLPQHLAELNAFTAAPLECFSRLYTSPECAIYFTLNPFVVESHDMIPSTMHLIPGILLTAHGALREVLLRSNIADLIAAHSSDFKLSLDMVNVDPSSFKNRMKRQREHITELLDKIVLTNSHTKHTLNKMKQLYIFLHENQLRHYIPKSKCFNNQTYADYDAEFTMYYRMATVGASFK